MSLFDQDIGCCGASFEKNNISFLGLLTFSATVIVVLSLTWVVTFPVCIFTHKLHDLIKVIIRANQDLIKSSSILRKTKCIGAGKILRYSPWLSGIFFRYFNYAFLFSSWLVVGGALSWLVFR